MITKISITKFRKLENVVEDKIGLVNELYGSNGCGKTSFINFINWVLIGETQDFGKNDDSNLDDTNYYENIGGEIIVKSTNDKEYTFARNYGYDEDTNKKSNDYFVNGRKVKNQKEYFASIEECFNLNLNIKPIKDFNLYKAFTDVYYLGENETQFRELITQLLGIDTNEILLATDYKDNKYDSIRNDYSDNSSDYDKTKSFYTQKIKETDGNIEFVKNQIEEDKKFKFNEKEYNDITNQIKELKDNYSYKSNVELSTKAQLKDKLLNDLQNSKLADIQNNNKECKEEIELKELKKTYNDKVDLYNSEIQRQKGVVSSINLVKLKINSYNKDLQDVQSKKFEEIVCPKCNTIINENGVKEFNKNKASKIKQINDKLDIANKELETYQNDKGICTNELSEELDEMKETIKTKELALQDILKERMNNLSSEETKRLEAEYNTLNKEIEDIIASDNVNKEKYDNEYKEKLSQLNAKYNELVDNKSHYDRLQKNIENKKVLLENKSTYTLRKSLLEEFKQEEIGIIKNETSKIFGNDFDFVMTMKNKSNDSYKKCCTPIVNGISYQKSNTALELMLGIKMVESIKTYIKGCNLPIIFDIADNIGKTARNEIFNSVSSQIFYTRIDDEDNVERELRIIK